MFFGRKGFDVEPRQIIGLTMIGFNGLLALCLALFAVGLFSMRPMAVCWTKRLAWVRLFTLAYSTTKTLFMLVGIFRLPDRSEVFVAVFVGLAVTIALSLVEGGYLFYLLRKLGQFELSVLETKSEQEQSAAP